MQSEIDGEVSAVRRRDWFTSSENKVDFVQGQIGFGYGRYWHHSSLCYFLKLYEAVIARVELYLDI